MSLITLVYHDVVAPQCEESSGFPGQEAARYKMHEGVFERHLQTMRQQLGKGVVDTLPIQDDSTRRVLLTFDDGGITSYTHIADALERYGWRGHFLITTGCIGLPGFMNGKQIVELHRRGHVIGSHSWRHPVRMADCSWDVLLEEWSTSIHTLQDLIGDPVTVGAVPGGLSSTKVVRAAAACGIRHLFTSLSTEGARQVHSCEVLGRFPMLGSTRSATVGGLVAGNPAVRWSQQMVWGPKYILRHFGGPYTRVRRYLLRTSDSDLPTDLILQLAQSRKTSAQPKAPS
jgi:peptidoglycan/xylan/chitin deacetylase (PgdA/CDA1 family)